MLAEKYGTLNLKSRKKNHSGAAKKQDRKIRLRGSCWGLCWQPTSAGLPKSGAPASEKPDPDPVEAQYFWAPD